MLETKLRDILERKLRKKLKDPLLTEQQLETLRRFDWERVASGVGSSVGTRLNYARVMGGLGRACPKPYDEMTKEDIIDFLAHREMADNTRITYLIALKGFFRWLYGLPKGEYPKQVSWIKNLRKKSNITKSDLITSKELKRMISMALTDRDKAIVAILWETAFRRGEFTNLDMRDIEEKHYGFSITTRISKTEMRTVPISQTAGYLARWLNSHPHRDDPDAPLWISFQNNNFGHRVNPVGGIKYIVKRIAQLAGVKKNVYPHLFRHTKLTDLARMGMHEGAMRKFAGWAPTSNMPSFYIHLSGVDVEREALRASGIEMEPERPMLETRECLRCGFNNVPTAIYCERCGTNIDRPIYGEPDIQDIIQMQKELRERLTRVDQLIERRQVNSIPQTLVQ